MLRVKLILQVFIFLGQHYTPEYCQTRCTSLRDQYSREKRNIKDDYKSGNSCPKRITFPFFKQLSFLDNFIKRRRLVDIKLVTNN